NKDFIYYTKKAKTSIVIDGILEEPDWHAAQKASDFFLVTPVDTGFARQQTEALITFDDHSLYLAFTLFDTIPGKRIMESFRRDFDFRFNDNWLVIFDSFLDQTTGFYFGASASGAEREGTLSEGGISSNSNWDCKWESKTKQYDDKWITEARIPLKSIRYPSESQQWNVNFCRLDLKSSEKSAWAPMPRQFFTSALAYAGVLRFDEPLPQSKMQFSFIPYMSGRFTNDYEISSGNKYHKEAGFDAKIGFSSSMNLDLTFNPDFGQVEVDQQVTNIERFELFFPEKRQFYLENSDLFSGFGYNTVSPFLYRRFSGVGYQIVTPFFSRRIGLDAPVIGGARLSGKIGNDLRIGFMNMTTKQTDDFPVCNYTVTSLQKKVFSRSNFGLIFVNKENISQADSNRFYNRVAGFDYNLATKDNIWEGKFFYHRSFQPENPDKQYSQGAVIKYESKHWKLGLAEISVGENYRAETGFVRRTGYNFLEPELTYLFLPNKRIVSHGISIELENYFNPQYHKIEHNNSFSYLFEFRDRSQLSVGYQDMFVELQEDFDPTHISDYTFPAGTSYHFGGEYINYQSTYKTMFNWSATVAAGKFYTGKIRFIESKMVYRFQPFVNFSMNLNYTDLDLPAPFKPMKFWLLGPKMDLTFSKNIFLSTFVQYNEQTDNLNINTRFQYRYKPLSDIYFVYTDNYIPGTWNSRNRALILKMTYWFN
ncbi:MAG: DUF5916 domain-containing protein, partial [Prolixibacteraceae bacterium]|nr:DUF5916 domain-containing protein [Prolixibacteraceae bacterium]